MYSCCWAKARLCCIYVTHGLKVVAIAMKVVAIALKDVAMLFFVVISSRRSMIFFIRLWVLPRPSGHGDAFSY